MEAVDPDEATYCCNWTVYTNEPDPGDNGVINLDDIIEAGIKALGLPLYLVETDLVDCGNGLW